ncbi:vigilin [Nephila pilipes]|uniref:Vigilin n=1 Tax=Nephila pilipes TaxID=299642 RepID=A0A8X6N0U6_NEPPI|nr:vigilin [Nephila pilipes]GFS96408.1 vigilin [Nephila pilipes]
MYYPLIFGSFNEILNHKETINQIIGKTETRINTPPAFVKKDELTIAEEYEAGAKAKTRIQNIYEVRKRNCQRISIEVSKNQHKYIIGPRGQTT